MPQIKNHYEKKYAQWSALPGQKGIQNSEQRIDIEQSLSKIDVKLKCTQSNICLITIKMPLHLMESSTYKLK